VYNTTILFFYSRHPILTYNYLYISLTQEKGF